MQWVLQQSIQQTRHCCSIVIGGEGEGKREKRGRKNLRCSIVIGVGVESKVKADKEDADGNLMHREYRPDYIWVAPISTPAQIRQYRKELCDTVAALPFATVVPAPISDDDDVPEICSDGSDDDPINLTLLSIA